MTRRSRSAGRARGPSQRQLRAGELIRHALADVLSREDPHDAELTGVSITVTEVRMSPDLRQATCFVMPLAGRDGERVLGALKRNGAWLGGQVARRIEMKFSPRLHFAIDASFDEAARIEALLQRPDVREDWSRPADDSADGSGESDGA